MEKILHEKFDCQEVFNELGNVNRCTGNLTDSSAIDYQLPFLNISIVVLIDTVSPIKVIKNKNIIEEIKNSSTKISPNNGHDNNKGHSSDPEFRSSIQIEQSSTCINIEAILKELDVEHDRNVSKAIISYKI